MCVDLGHRCRGRVFPTCLRVDGTDQRVGAYRVHALQQRLGDGFSLQVEGISLVLRLALAVRHHVLIAGFVVIHLVQGFALPVRVFDGLGFGDLLGVGQALNIERELPGELAVSLGFHHIAQFLLGVVVDLFRVLGNVGLAAAAPLSGSESISFCAYPVCI